MTLLATSKHRSQSLGNESRKCIQNHLANDSFKKELSSEKIKILQKEDYHRSQDYRDLRLRLEKSQLLNQKLKNRVNQLNQAFCIQVKTNEILKRENRIFQNQNLVHIRERDKFKLNALKFQDKLDEKNEECRQLLVQCNTYKKSNPSKGKEKKLVISNSPKKNCNHCSERIKTLEKEIKELRIKHTERIKKLQMRHDKRIKKLRIKHTKKEDELLSAIGEVQINRSQNEWIGYPQEKSLFPTPLNNQPNFGINKSFTDGMGSHADFLTLHPSVASTMHQRSLSTPFMFQKSPKNIDQSPLLLRKKPTSSSREKNPNYFKFVPNSPSPRKDEMDLYQLSMDFSPKTGKNKSSLEEELKRSYFGKHKNLQDIPAISIKEQSKEVPLQDIPGISIKEQSREVPLQDIPAIDIKEPPKDGLSVFHLKPNMIVSACLVLGLGYIASRWASKPDKPKHEKADSFPGNTPFNKIMPPQDSPLVTYNLKEKISKKPAKTITTNSNTFLWWCIVLMILSFILGGLYFFFTRKYLRVHN